LACQQAGDHGAGEGRAPLGRPPAFGVELAGNVGASVPLLM
jgi:hypothetical protein